MRDFFFANDQFNPQEFNSDTFGDIGQNSSKKWTGNVQTGSWVVPHIEFRSGEPPKSRIRVGFGFRVSGFVDWNPLSLSVSGFGFRRLKPTFAVGFGFRVSGFVDWNPLSLSVSGFGFRRLKKPTFAVGFGFRVSGSGFVDWNPLLLSGFGFRRLKPTFAVRFGIRVSGFGFRRLKLTLAVRFGFRRSKPPLDSPVRCRSHITQVSFSMQSSKTRAVSDKRLKRSERKNGNGLGETSCHWVD